MDIDQLLPLNEKARQSIANCGFLTVWEGAVRSAKTTASVYAFLMEVIKSPDNRHLMIGRSQAAIMANCVDSDFGLIDLAHGAAKVRTDKTGETYVDILGKRVDLFGGEHVSSFKAFRGRTYGMSYVDEANLQHQNTIAEIFNRTIASKARKHFFTLNPDAPSHWIYRDYVDKYRDDNVPGYRWFHFTLDDNPAITDERKRELKAQYTGVFYDRFILGKRVRAEGRCYVSYDRSLHVIDKMPGKIYQMTMALDFGGNKSATAGCATGWYLDDQKRICLVILDELYDTENKSVESVKANWKRFYDKQAAAYTVTRAFGDSAEQLIIKSIREMPVLYMENAMKRPIIDRIRLADTLFAQGRLHIMAHCKNTIEAFENACYDMKAQEDKRLDDSSSNIDSLDAFEYSVERDMDDLIKGA